MEGSIMTTLHQLQELTGKEVFDYLDQQAEVPLVSRAACQGDVSILRVTTKPATTPIPKVGIVVASGQGGHDHTLHGPGMFDRAPQRLGSLVVGQLTVPAGKTVFLSHPEHGGMEIAPGTYSIGSQREYAGEWRRVAD
jgi:hypothetical protein